MANVAFLVILAIINPILMIISAFIFINLGEKHFKKNWQSIKNIGKIIILLLGFISVMALLGLVADYLLFNL